MLIGAMSTENVVSISRAQCRGARGLLDLTQPELAAAAGLGLSTIVDFERARRYGFKGGGRDDPRGP